MKAGRNALCPCGSGKKFKKCHLGSPTVLFLPLSAIRPNPLPPGLVEKARSLFARKQLEEKQRIATFGKVRPIMHISSFHGKMLVSVRATLYAIAENSTFTNFLFDYGLVKRGDDWINQQNALLSNRNTLWFFSISEPSSSLASNPSKRME